MWLVPVNYNIRWGSYHVNLTALQALMQMIQQQKLSCAQIIYYMFKTETLSQWTEKKSTMRAFKSKKTTEIHREVNIVAFSYPSKAN